MSNKLIVIPEAQQDLLDAYDWYETRRPGLGEEFLCCVDACIQTIARSPELASTVHENYRRVLVRRFPYVVFYEISGSQVIVYCVFHTARDPQKWKRRLP